jgi:neutral amino acid transport system permease protein
VLQSIFFGVMTGSVLVVASTGFALIRNTEGFLNIAHGQFMLIGALIAQTAASQLGFDLVSASALAVVAVGLAGAVVGWLVFFPLRQKGMLAQFFTSIGVAFVAYGLVSASWSGAAVKVFDVDFGEPLSIGSLSVTPGEIGVIAVSWISVFALHLFLAKTRLGAAVRAIAGNQTLARLRGVRVDRAMMVVWFVASALAALAGVLVGLLGSIHTELGWHYILIILAVTVAGGIRNLYGVMLSGLLLGLIIEVGALLIPSAYATAIAFAAIIITLLFRPEGILSVNRRKEAGA